MYHFTADWFAPNIPTFERVLGPLKGRSCRLLEIGTYEGRATTWLADNIGGRIDTIDAAKHEKLEHNIGVCANGSKITFHLGSSDTVLRKLPLDCYDFAYIDGCHSAPNVLEDAVLAFRLVKVGGVMAFDDYLWDDPNYPNHEGRPKAAIDTFLKIYAARIELLHRGNQVWLRKRASEAPANDFVAPESYRIPSFWRRAKQRLRVARVVWFGR
jgi:hypothetical protein